MEPGLGPKEATLEALEMEVWALLITLTAPDRGGSLLTTGGGLGAGAGGGAWMCKLVIYLVMNKLECRMCCFHAWRMAFKTFSLFIIYLLVVLALKQCNSSNRMVEKSIIFYN